MKEFSQHQVFLMKTMLYMIHYRTWKNHLHNILEDDDPDTVD